MKIPATGSVMKSDGDFAPTDFNIEISAHAFSVLSKGLYSDPYRAIVRELCCNAWDSHVEAGTTDRPFELCLPNTLAPTFKVRDFGVGLSEIGIRQVYTTYFKSTKQGNDKQTGCFGLGSKSPYAYTKKFTVVSFFNGTRFHYNAIINENGFPQILKMAETPTTEPNGVEVSFAVESQDFYDFERAARVVLRPFVVKPIVKGRTNFVQDSYPADSLLSGPGWRLFRSLDGGNLAVMGNVEYPIEPSRKGFSSNAKKVLGLAIVIDFPLGSFEMTPSRESIQWTDFTTKNINDRLEVIYDEVFEAVVKQIESSATFWEASLNTYKFLYASPLRNLQIQPIWKGKLVTQWLTVPEGVTALRFTAIAAKGKTHAKNAASVNKVPKIEPQPTKFYLADFTGAEYRLGNLVRDTFDRHQSCYLIQPLNQAKLDEFCAEMGIPQSELILASTIPKRVRTGGGNAGGGRRSRLTGSKARAYQFDVTGSGDFGDAYWNEAEIDLEEADLGIYVEIDRWNLSGSKIATKGADLRRFLSTLDELDIKLPDGGIVGVKVAHTQKFKDCENWTTLDVFVQEKLQEFWESDKDFRYAFEYYEEYGYQERNFIAEVVEFSAKAIKGKHLSETAFIPRFSETFNKRIFKHEKKVRSFGYARKVMDTVVMPHKTVNDIDYAERIQTRYPLLRSLVGSYSWRDKIPAIAEYVTLLDDKISNTVKGV